MDGSQISIAGINAAGAVLSAMAWRASHGSKKEAAAAKIESAAAKVEALRIRKELKSFAKFMRKSSKRHERFKAELAKIEAKINERDKKYA
jgi:peptidoglycan hydrolase CwlO-like protein